MESLIPPNQGKKPDSGQTPSFANSQSQGAQLQPVEPAPPKDLPVATPLEEKREEQEFLPAPEEEKLLEAPHFAETATRGKPHDPPAQSSGEARDEKPAPAPKVIARISPALPDPLQTPKAKIREDSIFYLETSKIHPNQHQPRKHFDEEAIRDLAASIREFGVLQPIVVTKHSKETSQGTDVEYELIAGERRLLAAKSLGMEHIPSIIRHVDLERERLELAIIENLQREDLNGIEMARAFARLQDEFRLTQREIAARLGKSRESVANTLRLLDLPSYIQEAIEKAQITESHGLFLLGVDDPAAQQALFQDLLSNKLTIRELKQKARGIMRKGDTPEEAASSSEFRMFEEELSANLGAPVSIEKRGPKGHITIRFYSEEELRAILDKLHSEES